MIYDALSSLKEPNGSDTSTLVNFIEVYRDIATLSGFSFGFSSHLGGT